MLNVVNLAGLANPKSMPTYGPDGTATFTIPKDASDVHVR